MRVNIKKVKDEAIIPTYGSTYSAGMDLYACIPDGDSTVSIAANCTQKIGTGIAMEIPEGYFGAVFARSGLATKNGLRPANCVGVIDSDYRGEIIVALHNDKDSQSEEAEVIKHGTRIAQLVIIPYLPVELVEVDELSDTARGAGGFGSTGVNVHVELPVYRADEVTISEQPIYRLDKMFMRDVETGI